MPMVRGIARVRAPCKLLPECYRQALDTCGQSYRYPAPSIDQGNCRDRPGETAPLVRAMKSMSPKVRAILTTKKPSMLREHFGQILTAVISVASGLATYFAVTSNQLAFEAQKLALTAQKTAGEMASISAQTASAIQQTAIDLRKAEAGRAEAVLKWVSDLQGNDPEKIRSAAVSLALGGPTNHWMLVAALLDPNQVNGEKIKFGLRVASLTNAAEVCATLSAGLRIADSRSSAESIARSLGDLECTSSLETLKEVRDRTRFDFDTPISTLDRIASQKRK
jgi:hypothetical protein